VIIWCRIEGLKQELRASQRDVSTFYAASREACDDAPSIHKSADFSAISLRPGCFVSLQLTALVERSTSNDRALHQMLVRIGMRFALTVVGQTDQSEMVCVGTMRRCLDRAPVRRRFAAPSAGDTGETYEV